MADVMREAGLTHGGFYAHFASRDALLAEAVARAGRSSAARIERRVDAAQARGASALRTFIESYLDDAHLADAERGCPVAALVSEMPRQPAEVREASSARVRRMIAYVQSLLPSHVPAERASVVTGALVGALQMARAVGSADEGRAMLAVARRTLLEQFDEPPPVAVKRSSRARSGAGR